MPHPFPHHYEISLAWAGGENSEISSGSRPKLPGGPPAQFDGTDETRWSPEHLLLTALAQCMMLTYFALNKRAGIETKSYTSRAESSLDKTKEGIVFTSFKVTVELKVPAARIDEAKRLLESAKKHCIISNALKTPASIDARVEAGP